MAQGTESLNAAVCGSVIMFERMRQLLITDEFNQ
jgi:tRNA G18 (ribose-2'-O)-methylase SpoU